jgi:hypothetical protein
METVKSFTGTPVTPKTKKKYRDKPVWHVRWFNFQTNKWESEGERLTYKQAYNRAYSQARKNPYCRIDLALYNGRVLAEFNGKTPTESVGTDA